MERITALELFRGIGGFAVAVAGTGIRVVAALDQSPVALDVYRLNFPDHPTRRIDLERISAPELAGFGADLWWLSPPCQPYSIRGKRQDLADPRARSLARLMEVMPEIPETRLPRYLALENVAGFADSQARDTLLRLLSERNYQTREHHICPTMLGIPLRRPRYYLTASRGNPASSHPVSMPPPLPLSAFLDPGLHNNPPVDLLVPQRLVTRFGRGMRILAPDDPAAYTTCFTSGYGKSLMHAGSYLRCAAGVRRFSPGEIARLLRFPPSFRFPDGIPLRKRWGLLGNSLSVAAVRETLRRLPLEAFSCQPESITP